MNDWRCLCFGLGIWLVGNRLGGFVLCLGCWGWFYRWLQSALREAYRGMAEEGMNGGGG